MANIITITDGSSQVILDDLEVYQIESFTHQNVIVKRLLNGEPILTYVGAEWEEFAITIHPEYTTTASNVKALKDYGLSTFKYYYQNGTLIDNLTVKVDPRIKTKFIHGGLSKDLITIKLYEATGGSSVASLFELGVSSYGVG